MKIISLVENTSDRGLPVEHGLSLYIQTLAGEKILFDMGQGTLFAENARMLGLALEEVSVAVLSHGHYDHGGGLATFLRCNTRAPVYLHRQVFEPHFSLREQGLRYIGLDPALKDSPRLRFNDGLLRLGDDMILFSGVSGSCCKPVGNRLLFGPDPHQRDTFAHEQSLLIREGRHILLFAGCAHTGILNILRAAERCTGWRPTHVFAGMHLVKSGLPPDEEDRFIRQLATGLRAYPTSRFYTMHCTGLPQFEKLKKLMGAQISYFSCGDQVEI